MKFRTLAELSERLESTTKRGEIVDLAAGFLKRLKPEEVDGFFTDLKMISVLTNSRYEVI